MQPRKNPNPATTREALRWHREHNYEALKALVAAEIAAFQGAANAVPHSLGAVAGEAK